MKYLIVGLGNIGEEYWGTRHNVGFRMANAIAEEIGATFTEQRYGAIARGRIKNAELVLLKPSTYMNLSGEAVRYWLQKENLPTEQLLILVDDLALDFGTLRLKSKGSDAGHNGLKNIAQLLGTAEYARLRFGLGSRFSRGRQIEFVLGHFTPEEEQYMPLLTKEAVAIVRDFCLSGIYNIRKDTIMKYCEICGYKFTFKDRIKGRLRLHSKHTLECSQCGSFYISEATIYSFLYNFMLGFLLSSFIIFVSKVLKS